MMNVSNAMSINQLQHGNNNKNSNQHKIKDDTTYLMPENK